MVVSANLLPNGKQQFCDGNGKPYASGKVYFYIPTTTTFKNTWSDPEKGNLNTNPVTLDANGEAVIFGDGEYRQILKDVNGVQIWDQLTLQYVTVGGDLSGTLPNPTVNPSLFINQFNTNKNPPVNADRFLALDSGNALAPIYFLWSQMVSQMGTALQTVFDSHYAQSDNIGPGFSGLSVNVVSDSQVTVTAGKLVGFNSGGDAVVGNGLALTANIGTSGANGLDTGAEAANTWYNVWAIYDLDTLTWASLLSLSNTTPTMPTGYAYKVRVGVVRNDGSSNFFRTLQIGNQAQYVIGTNPTVARVCQNGVIGTWDFYSPTLATVDITGFAPPTAATMQLGFYNQWKDLTVSHVIAAPNASWGGPNNGPNGSNGQIFPIRLPDTPEVVVDVVEWVRESGTFAMASSAAGCAVAVYGWRDNL